MPAPRFWIGATTRCTHTQQYSQVAVIFQSFLVFFCFLASRRFPKFQTRSDSQWDARRQHRKARLQRKKPAVDCHDVELTTVLPQDAVECLAGDEKLAAYKSLARHSHRLDTESLVRAVVTWNCI